MEPAYFNSAVTNNGGCDYNPGQQSGLNMVRAYDFETDQAFFGEVLVSEYPTSSPWVTSVGATALAASGDFTTCSSWDGAAITGGGGFNALTARPKWQETAVTEWLSAVTAAGDLSTSTFNVSRARSMRGYPDVALNGHNYQIVSQFGVASVDGTSASTPVFAGMLSLINAHLQSEGKATLGFVNPLLYSLAANPSTADAFQDVTTGDNRCNRFSCCQYGYDAAVGWDPATGLGGLL